MDVLVVVFGFVRYRKVNCFLLTTFLLTTFRGTTFRVTTFRRTALCCGLLLVLGCQTESKPTQLATVQGASMFPALPGNHYRLKCQDCSFHFKIDADNLPKNRIAVCPNCGNMDVAIGLTKKQASKLLEIQPITNPIKRWDVVAFKIPDELKSGGNVGVKRVVGLPGETIRISGGDVLVDGRVAGKSLALQRQMRIQINDSRFFVPRSEPRWTLSDGWARLDAGGWMYGPKDSQTKISQLNYRHESCYRTSGNFDSPAPIQDNYGCNQNVARSLNNIRDAAIEVDVSITKNSRLEFRFESGPDVTRAILDFGKDEVRLTNSAEGTEVQASKLPKYDSETVTIEVCNFDGQTFVGINGNSIFEANWEQLPRSASHPALEIGIGTAQDSALISRIRVYRDIYYFLENGSDEQSAWKLGSDEYFLLGDNCPVSIDSRKFGPIRRESIVGRLELGGN